MSENCPHLINETSNVVTKIEGTTFTVGRSLQCNLVLDSTFVSRIHFTLEKEGEKWILHDKSSNGTLVNNKLINHKKCECLKNGDVIKVGPSQISFTFKNIEDEFDHITDEQLCQIADNFVNTYETSNNSLNAVLEDHCYENGGGHEQESNGIEVLLSQPRNEPSPSACTVVQTVLIDLTPVEQELPHVQTGTVEESSLPSKRPHESTDPRNSAVSRKKLKTNTEDDDSATKTASDASKCVPGVSKEDTDNFNMVEDELQCSICSELFIKAVTLNCSHSFCRYCINQWKKHQLICPICRTQITGMNHTLVLDNFISKALETANEEIKEHRKEIVKYREDEEKKTEQSNPSTSNVARNTENNPSITISSASTSDASDFEGYDEDHWDEYENWDDEDDDDDDFTDYSDSDYNGVPGQYYGGYGKCYFCHRSGHWSNGCPYK